MWGITVPAFFGFHSAFSLGMTATAFLYVGYLFKQYDVIAFIEKYWLLWIPIIAVWALFF